MDHSECNPLTQFPFQPLSTCSLNEFLREKGSFALHFQGPVSPQFPIIAHSHVHFSADGSTWPACLSSKAKQGSQMVIFGTEDLQGILGGLG